MKEKFLSKVRKAGAEVSYYGVLYDQQQKIKLSGMCDHGLNIMKEDVVVGLTIKSVDYFSMGIPVINSIKGDTWSIVEQRGVGINIKSKEETLNKLHEADVVEMSNNAFCCFNNCFSKEAYLNTLKEGLNI